MNLISKILTLSLIFGTSFGIAFPSDFADANVVITELNKKYVLKSDANRHLSEVKASSSYTYQARRADDRALAYEYYSSETPIKKASAPGSKPIYKSVEDDDIFYSGMRVCALPLELKKGKPVTARFERDYTALEQFGDIMIASDKFVEQACFEITVPSELADVIKVQPYDMPSTAMFTSATDKNGNLIYSLRISDLEPFRHEDYAAPATQTVPRIIVTGQFSTVDDLYDFLRSNVDNDDPEPEVAAMARQVTENCADDKARIHAIASWVRQNIRYVGIEHGELGKRPDTAGNVLSKRYGDCKGSANLIRQMLRACGIDGRRVWIGTRGNVIGPFSRYRLFGCADHMIAAAVLNDSIIYLDGTTSFSPRDYLPYSIAGQEAIVEAGDSCLLTTLPAYVTDRYPTEIKGSFALDGNTLTGDISITMRGNDRMAFENFMADVNVNQRLSLCHAWLAQSNSATYTDVANSTDAPDAQTSTLSAHESDSKAVVPAGAKRYVSLHPLRNWTLKPVNVNNRRRPVSTGSPYNIITSMELAVPEGYTVESMPKDATVDTPWFAANLSYRQDGGRITVTGAVKGLETDVPLTDIPEWNEAVKAINRMNNDAIILTVNQ